MHKTKPKILYCDMETEDQIAIEVKMNGKLFRGYLPRVDNNA